MKQFLFILFLTCFSTAMFSQNEDTNKTLNQEKTILLPAEEYIEVPEEFRNKILNYKLIEHLSIKRYLFKNGKISADRNVQGVILYFTNEPDAEQKELLKDLGVVCNWELYTHTAGNHPLGFVTASIPVDEFEKILRFDFLKKMDSSETILNPDIYELLKGIPEDKIETFFDSSFTDNEMSDTNKTINFEVYYNYPDPFFPETIQLFLPSKQNKLLFLEIIDIRGNSLNKLFGEEDLKSGRILKFPYQKFESGVYLLKLTLADESIVKKIIVIR